MAKSILFQVGILGHIPQLAVFQKVFNCPVVAISLTEEIAEAIKDSGAFSGKHYAFSDFFLQNKEAIEKASANQLVDRLRLYEAEWDFCASSLFFMDRYLRNEQSYDRAIRKIVLLLDFAQKILKEQDPLFSKGNVTTLFGLALQRACLSRGVPCPKPQTSRLPGRTEFQDETALGYLRGWKATYEALGRDPKIVPDSIRNEALRWLQDFREKPTRPNYAERNSVVRFSLEKVCRRVLASAASKFSTSYWKKIYGFQVDREFLYSAKFGKSFIDDFILREIRASFQRFQFGAKAAPDLCQPYVYFPLQFHPEISTLVYGALSEDQAATVEKVAKSLPQGLRLLVKDHTSMLGRRPANFYRRLAALYNVEIVPPAFDTFALIRNSRAVITISSTAGWEAFVLGKPVLVLGQVFYGQFPNVLEITPTPDMPRKIGEYIRAFKPNDSEILRAVTAVFSVTGKQVGVGDIGADTERDDVERNAIALAEEFKRQLERFPLSSLTHPPKTCLAVDEVRSSTNESVQA